MRFQWKTFKMLSAWTIENTQKIFGKATCFYHLILPRGLNILHVDLANDSLRE